MTELSGGVTTYASGGTEFDEGGTNFYWFDAIKYFGTKVGTDDPRYQFWCQACADAIPLQLINMSTLLEQPAPYYYCLTAGSLGSSPVEGFTQNWLCQAFFTWVFSSFWADNTGQQEQPTCSNAFG